MPGSLHCPLLFSHFHASFLIVHCLLAKQLSNDLLGFVQGMWKSNDNVPPTLNTLPRRLWMSVSLRGMRSVYWASCVVQDLFDAVMFVPISMAHRMFEARYI